MANKEFGIKLREIRNLRGLTQQNVADKLGLKNKSTLGNWEIGNSEPDAATFLKLCEIYRIENILGTFGYDDLSDIKASYHEQAHLEKYRALDERGRTNVDNLLESEYQHISKEIQKRYTPQTVAAHNDDDWSKEHNRDVEMVKQLVEAKKERETRERRG